MEGGGGLRPGRLTRKHGKGKGNTYGALGILLRKLGRTVYYMLRRGDYFDEQAFLGAARRTAA